VGHNYALTPPFYAWRRRRRGEERGDDESEKPMIVFSSHATESNFCSMSFHLEMEVAKFDICQSYI
jgi:hypothetical protein